ncbi:MAG: hypothetical protein AMJ91_04385 [candidate division Zixibacteria bacterium SM23_73_3]|nr:MAG: hypothetical protein AMJ91_04385 [candidate division Zixibacteria bacterium SM23_73_3]
MKISHPPLVRNVKGKQKAYGRNFPLSFPRRGLRLGSPLTPAFGGAVAGGFDISKMLCKSHPCSFSLTKGEHYRFSSTSVLFEILF